MRTSTGRPGNSLALETEIASAITEKAKAALLAGNPLPVRSCLAGASQAGERGKISTMSRSCIPLLVALLLTTAAAQQQANPPKLPPNQPPPHSDQDPGEPVLKTRPGSGRTEFQQGNSFQT